MIPQYWKEAEAYVREKVQGVKPFSRDSAYDIWQEGTSTRFQVRFSKGYVAVKGSSCLKLQWTHIFRSFGVPKNQFDFLVLVANVHDKELLLFLVPYSRALMLAPKNRIQDTYNKFQRVGAYRITEDQLINFASFLKFLK